MIQGAAREEEEAARGGDEVSRSRDDRGKRRTPHDLTDEEGTRIAPPIPPASHGGNKRTVIMPEGVNALVDVRTGG